MSNIEKRLLNLTPEKRALLSKRLSHSDVAGQASSMEPLAIIGMGCRFPGGANSPDLFWCNFLVICFYLLVNIFHSFFA